MKKIQHLTSIRVFLASLVIWSHSYPLTGNPEALASLIGETGGTIAVVGFFFISGYLVTQSYVRHDSAIIFFMHRVLRIWPALVIALVFSAIVGYLVSSADHSTALTSAKHFFWHNLPLINGIQFQITGAFTTHPNTSINGSLWTLPLEVKCYLVVMALGFFQILKRPTIALLSSIAILIAIYLTAVYQPWNLWSNLHSAVVVFSFFIGVSIFYLKNHISFGTLSFLLILLGFITYQSDGHLRGLTPVLITAGIILLISFTELLPKGDAQNDPSYGIYIYAFPIQQTVIYFLPDSSAFFNFLISISIVYVISFASWTYIEKPMIALGKKITTPTSK